MIPVYINVRNRLTTTRALAEQVAALPDAVPILVDNNSDWQPLLDWYESCPFEVIRLSENVGHHAPWLRAIPAGADFIRRWGSSRYAVTDCDLDIAECPTDVLQVLQEPFAWSGIPTCGSGTCRRKPVVKSGLSLRINDLPPWQVSVKQWESRWWRAPVLGGRFYIALIDTTFAMYDCRTPHQTATRVVGVPAVRSAPPYCAKHVPWYLDGNNLDAENQHYFSTANSSNSWKPVGRGLGAAYVRPVRSPRSR